MQENCPPKIRLMLNVGVADEPLSGAFAWPVAYYLGVVLFVAS